MSRAAALRSQVLVENDTQNTLKLFIEPWGDLLVMDAGVKVIAVAESATEGYWHLSYSMEGFTITAWRRATFSTFDLEGVAMRESSVAVPLLP